MGLALWQAVADEEDIAIERIEAAYREASRTGDGDRMLTTQRALAVLYNGLGRYRRRWPRATVPRPASERWDRKGPHGAGRGVVAFGEFDVAAEAFQRLRQRTQNGGTDWALGVEASARPF